MLHDTIVLFIDPEVRPLTDAVIVNLGVDTVILLVRTGQRTLICAPRILGQQANDRTFLDRISLRTKIKHPEQTLRLSRLFQSHMSRSQVF